MKNNEKERRLFRLKERGLMPTLAILKNLLQLGIISRTFMLKEHDLILKDIVNGAGKYSDYSTEQKEWLESFIYIQLLERIFFLIEDFTKVINGLNGDLGEFLENFIHSPNPEKILSNLDYEKWNRILRYAELKNLPIPDKDKQFLSDVRNNTCEHLIEFVKFCLDFLNLHKIFFNKFKHGNSIIYGFKKIKINGETYFLIPAIYNRRTPEKTKAIIINRKIYEKWKTFHNSIVILISDLIKRTIAYIERDCRPFVEYISYCGMKPDELNRINKMIAKCDSNVIKINIVSTIKLTIDVKKLKKFTELYDSFDKIMQSIQTG